MPREVSRTSPPRSPDAHILARRDRVMSDTSEMSDKAAGIIRRRFLLGAACAGAVLLAACSGPAADNSGSQGGSQAAPPAVAGGPLKVAVITHGGAGDA